jgi:hypothetical protein
LCPALRAPWFRRLARFRWPAATSLP